MSHEAVQEVLNRALTDPAFRRQLLLEPDQAITGFDLTAQEAEALRRIRLEESAGESEALDERRSKARPEWIDLLF